MLVSTAALPTPPLVTKGYGGIEWIVYLLARELAKKGHNVGVACTSDSVLPDNVTHIKSTTPDERGFENIALTNYISELNNYDIVHDNSHLKIIYKIFRDNPNYKFVSTCYSEDTEILTSKGWLYFKDLNGTEEVMTLNPDTEELEYHKPTAYQIYDYAGEMYHYKGESIDLLVTPEHKLFFRTLSTNSEWQIQKANEIKYKYIEFNKTGKWIGKEEKEFNMPMATAKKYGRLKNTENIDIDNYLKLMGWYLSEGCTYINSKKGEYEVCFAQMEIHQEKRQEIIDIIKDLGMVPHYRTGHHAIRFCSKQWVTYLKQFGHAADKFVPENIKSLPPTKIMLFLETLFKGDGNYKNGKMCSYTSKSKKLIDDVQELLIKVGWGGSIGSKTGGYSNTTCFWLTVNKTKLTPIINLKMNLSKEYYKGKIYDLTVQNHIIMVRRNGKTVNSLNSHDPGCIDYPIEKPNHITVSKAHRKNHLQQKNIDSKVVYNTIDPAMYKFNKGERSDKYLFLSRPTSDKGPIDCIRMCQELDVPLDMVCGRVADITQEAVISSMMCKFGSKWKWMGEVPHDKKVELYQNAKAFLFPTSWELEPFGLVIVEALYSGCPVVTYDRGPMSELVEHGVTGYLAKDRDEFKKYMGMVDQIDSQKCHDSVIAKGLCSPDKMASQYLKLYEKALNNERW